MFYVSGCESVKFHGHRQFIRYAQTMVTVTDELLFSLQEAKNNISWD